MSAAPAQLSLPSIGRIDADFLAFHERHPEVYAELVRLARRAKAAGRRRVGMKQLFEVVRWEVSLSDDGGDGFKLDNRFSSRYSRLIGEQESDLAGLFETRAIRS